MICPPTPGKTWGWKVIERFCDWLTATPLSTAFQTWTWFVPMVQVVHIICVSVVFVTVLRVSVKLLWPDGHAGSVAELLDQLMPAVWTALILLLVSGTLLTITEPARELLNWVFRTKMILVLSLAGVLFAIRRLTRANAEFGATAATRPAARTAAITSIALGVAIITAGRWIAYV